MVARDRYGGASARSVAGASRTVVHFTLSPADVDPWHPSGRPGTLHGLRALTGASAPAQWGGVRAVVVTEALRSRSEAPGNEPGSCPAAGDAPSGVLPADEPALRSRGVLRCQTRSRSGGTTSNGDVPASRPGPFGGGTAAPCALRARELCRHRRSAPSGPVRGRTRRAHRTRPGRDSSLPRRFRPDRALTCAPPREARRRRRDAFGRCGGGQPSDAGLRAGSGGPDGSPEPWGARDDLRVDAGGRGTDRHQLAPDQPRGRRRARDGRLRSGGAAGERHPGPGAPSPTEALPSAAPRSPVRGRQKGTPTSGRWPSPVEAPFGVHGGTFEWGGVRVKL